MEFISAKDAANFLSQAAPLVWVHRTLHWMIIHEELPLYADKLETRPYCSVGSFTAQLFQQAGEFSGPKMDEAIRSEYSPEIAEKLVGREHDEKYYEDTNIEEGAENIGRIDIGYVLYSHGIDWQYNALEVTDLISEMYLAEWFFQNQDIIGSDLEDANFDVKFSGLKFEARRIEILLPTSKLDSSIKMQGDTVLRRPAGRPAKWDWDGAMAHVVSQAQTPDGLPTGHGAQAKIEEMIASWFESQTGDSPALSQIRSRASRIIEMINRS